MRAEKWTMIVEIGVPQDPSAGAYPEAANAGCASSASGRPSPALIQSNSCSLDDQLLRTDKYDKHW
jgi:hypothetical protein